MKITLPYPPSLNRLYRAVGNRVLISKDGRNYKNEVQKQVLFQKTSKLTGEIAIEIKVYRPQKRGDLDNTLKALIDSLQGICYENDSQIIEIKAYRFDDKQNPRAEVSIKEISSKTL